MYLDDAEEPIKYLTNQKEPIEMLTYVEDIPPWLKVKQQLTQHFKYKHFKQMVRDRDEKESRIHILERERKLA